jgi:hypothetical protein
MVKEALRATRRLSKKRGRNRAPRAKTFANQEAAKHWAKETGVENPEIQAKGKKFIVANA